MKRSEDILNRIQTHYPGMSKSQKKLADYILKHYDKAVYLTASRLGAVVNVSESTVVRFAAELEYDGYPAMQKALQEMIRNKLTSVQRIEVANNRFGHQELLSMVLQSDIEKIRTTMEEIDKDAFQAAVDDIMQAKTIYILGVRSSASIASFLSFYFNLMFDNVKHIHTSSNAEMFEQMVRISKDDVVIGISFPRYSSRTAKAMRFAYDRGATVIALTDSLSAPIAQNATHTLIAMSDMVSLVDSLVAPLSVVNALIVACSYKKEKEIAATFTDLETIWDEYGVYEKVDDGV